MIVDKLRPMGDTLHSPQGVGVGDCDPTRRSDCVIARVAELADALL